MNSDNKILEELTNKIPVENDFLFYYSVSICLPKGLKKKKKKKEVKNDYVCNFE